MNSQAAIEILRKGLPLNDVVVSGLLNLREFAEGETISSPVAIANCVLDGLDAGFISFQASVALENVTVLGDCLLHSCFFPAGFSAVHCRFKKGVDLRWGGHNKNGSVFRLEHCEFEEFADFEDDWFEGPVEIRECAFRRGANILGLQGHPLQVTFEVTPVIEFNSGSLDLNEAPIAG